MVKQELVHTMIGMELDKGWVGRKGQNWNLAAMTPAGLSCYGDTGIGINFSRLVHYSRRTSPSSRNLGKDSQYNY